MINESIKQPYAADIILGRKLIEYRGWAPKFRGRFIVCSSRRKDSMAFKQAEARGEIDNDMYSLNGYALGTVELYDVRECLSGSGYCWYLRKPEPFGKPFEVKGQLGLYSVDINDEEAVK